ncbi:MAG: flagellar hook-associated protein FlgK [Myxococcota bacterium]
MSTLFGVLSIGRNGMMAHQVASQTASHDATNANTLGHTRRMANLESLTGPPQPGLGSRARGARRVIDPFVEKRLLGARSQFGHSAARTDALAIFDHAFADADTDIGAALDALTRAFGDLSVSPGDPTARELVLARAESLGDAFQTTMEHLNFARGEINERVSFEVGQVNERLHQIASLGKEIAQAELDGREAGNLRDQRDQLVREVSDRVPVKVIEEGDGTINLLLDGSRSLVAPDGNVNELLAEFDPGTGDVSLRHRAAGAVVDIAIDGGAIGGLLEARDGALAATAAELDQLAFDVATAYNAEHSAGFGLDGVGGRNLFGAPAAVDGAALNFSVALTNRDEVAAAADPTLLPGDNRAALALTNLANEPIALGGTVGAVESYATLVGNAATALQQATLRNDAASASVDQVEALRQSVSGVSVDEAMVDLMQFQRGFQASLQVIQTADEMLAEIVNLR